MRALIDNVFKLIGVTYLDYLNNASACCSRRLPSAYSFGLFAALALGYQALISILRGDLYSSWEIVTVVGISGRIYLNGFFEAFDFVLNTITHYQYWGGQSSLLYSYAPAVLHLLLPWEYWAHLWSLLLFFSFYILFINLSGLPLHAGISLLLLAPSLMSQAVLGSPHVSAIFTLCIALPALFALSDKPLQARSIIGELLLWVCLAALALNSYESSRIALLLPAVGAATMHSVSLRRRMFWIVLSLAAFVAVLWVVRGGAFNMTQVENPPALPHAPLSVAWDTLTWLLFSNYAESPLTFAAGLWAIFTVKKHRMFWIACLLMMFGLYFALVISPSNGIESIRGRRHALFSFFLVAAVAARVKEGFTPRQLFSFTTLLIVAAGSAYWQAIKFYSTSPSYPVPYAQSAADFRVDRQTVEDSRTIAAAAEARPHWRHFLLYDFDHYHENATDPAGLLERIQAKIGTQTFYERIFPVLRSRKSDRVYGCRYACSKFLPLGTLQAELSRITREEPYRELYIYLLKSDLCDATKPSESCSSELTNGIASNPELIRVSPPSELGRLNQFVVYRYQNEQLSPS